MQNYDELYERYNTLMSIKECGPGNLTWQEKIELTVIEKELERYEEQMT